MNINALLLIPFALFLLALIGLDVAMVVSLLKTGDERHKLIVWKTSTFTLLVVVLTLMYDVSASIVRMEAMEVNPFPKLSVIAMTYFVVLLYYKRKHGD